jgi:hypothetical protein
MENFLIFVDKYWLLLVVTAFVVNLAIGTVKIYQKSSENSARQANFTFWQTVGGVSIVFMIGSRIAGFMQNGRENHSD